ncbi:ATPase family AAA domain-containing protein 5 [Spea bombifrons]|uniref:ATPase family AAA domain-containing protein 5 n=1 Tax=Spea bombifrons TaxID=233779 RepID=UPI00234B63F6|nr:ATPase family AAA domain-containing protein 5 [Spea bombifrons]
MAGILTVSSPIGDYNVQPSKKQRKEDDPPVKTITNYFPPVSRLPEKELPSPRSNNIADYFKSSSPANETEQMLSTHTSSPRQDGTRVAAVNVRTPPSGDPGRPGKHSQRTRLCRSLNVTKPKEEFGDSAEAVCGGTGFMGSDTAALLAEICNNSDNLLHNKLCSSTAPKADSPNNKQSVQNKQDRETACYPPEKHSAGERPPQTPGDASLGATAGDVSPDSRSTVTVLFEDFLRSQEEKDSKHETPVRAASPTERREPSPNTVTIHAQVHLSPPLNDSCPKSKATKKIAAIFLRKGNGEPGKRAYQTSPEHADPQLQKRKSNVVIAEEDLELAVIEADHEPAKQKSTAAERHQFLKAFRQPGDTVKSTGKKNPLKGKDSSEISAPAANNCSSNPDMTAGDGATVDQPDETKSGEATSKSIKCTNKARKNNEANTATINRKKAKEKVARAAGAEASQLPTGAAGLRRSSRRRKSNLTPLKSPVKRPVESGGLLASTPKVHRMCRKSDIYKAEVITELSDAESPIRMKFTRLSTRRNRSQSVADEDVFTPRSKKVSGGLKKMTKAKELLEKAKAIQQNMAKNETPQRCSVRRARSKRKPALEDSVVFIDITGDIDAKITKNKNLRSLNDVLGKKAKKQKPRNISSDENNSAGTPPAPIMVIDDSSEASENSQDDRQFKAKREFLKSGLPDSLKRHISKTAAFMEAYSLSSSFFQSVGHVQQKDGSLMWSLSLPTCPQLARLCRVSADAPNVANLRLSLGDLTVIRNRLAIQLYSSAVKGHPALSNGVRDCLLEEISASNPLFPVKRFFKQLLKKQNDQLSLQEPSQTDNQPLEKSKVTLVEDCRATETSNRTKRKRTHTPVTASKRLKAETQHDCSTKPPTPQGPVCGPLSTSGRRNHAQGEERASQPPGERQPLPHDAISADLVIEDVLWTEKYQPSESSELVGNSAAVKRLHGWLKDWKVRAEKEEKRNRMNQTEKDKNDTWEQSDFIDSSESEEDSLCNTVLITGPPGVGKTAAVYACAQELGFKVFEVNASCQRNGRQILAQLKEATQSHQVDQQGVNAHRPCFFNSYGSTKSPRKLNSPKNVVSSPRKPPLSPRGVGLRKALAPKSLANYFRVPPKQRNEDAKTPEAPKGPANGKMTKSQVPSIERGQGPNEPPRRTATSLILFEEVDVIFDDDSGFLSAIKTFMTTTKRPVILTTSDPTFGLIFDGVFEEIKFCTPSVADVASFLQVLCLAENLRTDPRDFATFLTSNKCDVRQSLLHLQFWAKSGGCVREKQAAGCGKHSSGSKGEGAALKLNPEDLPRCNSGYAEHTAGLHNVVSPAEGLIRFVKNNIVQAEEWSRIVQLLTEFQMKNIDFISSNLELLLPLPVRVEGSDDCEPSGTSAKREKLAEAKPENPTKRRRNVMVLDDSDLFESNTNSMDEILTIPSGKSCQEEGKEKSGLSREPHLTFPKQKLTEAEKTCSRLVRRCLGSLAEFVDNMSHLDCFTYKSSSQAELCSYRWTEGRIKNGLCDELRVESRDWWSEQSSGELKATVEALAFRKCSSDISRYVNSSLELCKERGKDPSEDLTLRVSKDWDAVSFNQSAANPEVADRRLSVVRNVLSNRAFINLGNRQSNVTEYLPALRAMCRTQKLKEREKAKRRFLHYFEGIHLELPKATLSSLAADFP